MCRCPLVLILSTLAAVGAAEVTVVEDLLTLPLRHRPAAWETGSFRNGALFPPRDAQVHEGEVALTRLRLLGERLELWIFPEAGGAVGRAIDRTSGHDLFYWEGAVKDDLPFWESGVKASFPYPEHGMGSRCQPASWRVITHDDGSCTIAMWMEFSRHIGPQQRHMFGRYTPLLLSQFVTLSPDEAAFTVRYRIVNPVHYRQGRRIWNDAIFPRRHGPAGPVQGMANPPEPSDGHWIFPVAWVSDHLGQRLRRLDPAECLLSAPGVSLFAWDRVHGFVGLYHPAVDVNRLRLDDPRRSPGAKMWWPDECAGRADGIRPTANIAEVWGGADTVFEGVEHWLEPGEAWDFSHRFCLVAGIGPCIWADGDLVLGRRDGELCLASLRPLESLELAAAGAGTVAGPCAPGAPLRLAVDEAWQGRVVISGAGDEPIAIDLPLTIPDDTAGHERIAAAQDGLLNVERQGHAFNRGRQRSKTRAAEGSTQRGRIQAMQGSLAAAIATLGAAVAVDPEDGEAWHLLGCCHLEAGRHAAASELLQRALTAARPFPAAGHHLALCALAGDDRATAAARLDELLAARPAHWEGRLLRCWLAIVAGEADAGERLAAAAEEDGADPRLAWLAHVARSSDAERLALARLLEEPGAAHRLAEFQAATRGLLRHPPRPTEE